MSLSIVSDQPGAAASVLDALAKALSETMVETAKAQTYHWNVTGMAFAPLHALFQEMYEDHFAAQDELAERIRALGGHADGRLSNAAKNSTIQECDGTVSAAIMIESLAHDQRTLSKALRHLAHEADDHDDIVTSDLAIGRAATHDKFAWMLESHLSE